MSNGFTEMFLDPILWPDNAKANESYYRVPKAANVLYEVIADCWIKSDFNKWPGVISAKKVNDEAGRQGSEVSLPEIMAQEGFFRIRTKKIDGRNIVWWVHRSIAQNYGLTPP